MRPSFVRQTDGPDGKPLSKGLSSMPSNDPVQRALIGRIGAHIKWAHTENRTAATASARREFMRRFEIQVDPEGLLAPAELAVRSKHARDAYFSQLALRSAQARRPRAVA